jgi:hypothetical protein
MIQSAARSLLSGFLVRLKAFLHNCAALDPHGCVRDTTIVNAALERIYVVEVVEYQLNWNLLARDA